MNISEFEQILKNNNSRITKARLEIFNILVKSTKPLNVQQIYKRLKSSSKTDLASVYRNISVFLDLNIAHKIQDKIKICDHHSKDDHDHIHIMSSCKNCGETTEIKDHNKSICLAAKSFSKDSSALPEVNEIILYGVCKKCKKI